MIIFHESMRVMLRDRKYNSEQAHKEIRTALVNKLTLKQLDAYHRGKLKSKSREINSLVQRVEFARIESCAAHSAYNAFMDRMPDEVAS